MRQQAWLVAVSARNPDAVYSRVGIYVLPDDSQLLLPFVQPDKPSFAVEFPRMVDVLKQKRKRSFFYVVDDVSFPISSLSLLGWISLSLLLQLCRCVT